MSSSRATRRRVKETDPATEEASAVAATLHNGSPRSSGSTLHTQEEEERENIFLFYPNLIGYFRVVLAVGSLYYMPLHPRTCSLLYTISCLLDAVDGLLARRFDQSTKFGAVLDMVTDRCTTSCLLVFLSAAWPRWSLVFQFLLSLDLASHYMHMYATLTMAGRGESHKNVDASRSWLLHQYYTNKNVLFTLCAMNELFFIAAYLLSFSAPVFSAPYPSPAADPQSAGVSPNPGDSYWKTLLYNPNSPMYYAFARANKIDDYVPWILLVISLPFMAAKNWINVLQMVKASQWLAEGDRADRKAKGLPRKKKH